MSKLLKLIVITAVVWFGLSVSAVNAKNVTNIWNVSDAVGSHGLWTGKQKFNSNQFFHINNDVSFTQYDDGTARLLGTASGSGVTWNLNVSFDNVRHVPNAYGAKTGGGPALSSWLYYYDVAGTITNSMGDTFSVVGYRPAFQMGLGANDKTSAFGGASWLKVSKNGHELEGYWDLNLDFEVSPVPEPEIYALWLVGLGLLGLSVRRRRRIRV